MVGGKASLHSENFTMLPGLMPCHTRALSAESVARWASDMGMRLWPFSHVSAFFLIKRTLSTRSYPGQCSWLRLRAGNSLAPAMGLMAASRATGRMLQVNTGGGGAHRPPELHRAGRAPQVRMGDTIDDCFPRERCARRDMMRGAVRAAI